MRPNEHEPDINTSDAEPRVRITEIGNLALVRYGGSVRPAVRTTKPQESHILASGVPIPTRVGCSGGPRRRAASRLDPERLDSGGEGVSGHPGEARIDRGITAGACLVSFAALLVGTLLLSCAPHGAGSSGRPRASMSDAEQHAIGSSVDRLIRQAPGLYESKPDLIAYVGQVGSKVSSKANGKITYTFAILDTPDLNAFGLPGGFIYVSRGLLEWLGSEDELAAVLAHETAHVSLGHGLARLSKSAPGGTSSASAGETRPPVPAAPPDLRAADALLIATQGRTLGEEREADDLARTLIAGGGYDVGGAERAKRVLANARLLTPRRFAPWGDSHPGSSSERGTVEPHASAHSRKPPVTSVATGESGGGLREAYLTKIEGLAAGQANAASWVTGNLYVNTAHDFGLRIPPGWTSTLRGRDLALQGPSGRETAEVTVEVLNRIGVSADVAREYVRTSSRSGLELAGPMTKATLPAGEAAILPIKGQDEAGRPLLVRKLFLVRFDRVYILTFTVPYEEEINTTFMNLAGSIDFLTRERIQTLPAPRIALYRVKEGDTWDSIAADRLTGDSRNDPPPGGAADVDPEDRGTGAGSKAEKTPAPAGTKASRGERLAAFNGVDPGKPPQVGLMLKIPPVGDLE